MLPSLQEYLKCILPLPPGRDQTLSDTHTGRVSSFQYYHRRRYSHAWPHLVGYTLESMLAKWHILGQAS